MRVFRFPQRSLAVALASCLCVGLCAAEADPTPGQAQPARLLFVPAKTESQPPESVTIARARPVELAAQALSGLNRVGGDHVVLNLFDDARFLASCDKLEQRGPRSFTWSGRLLDDAAEGTREGSFILTVEQDAMILNLWTTDARAFEVRPAHDGRLWARELDQSRFERCAIGREHVWRAGDNDQTPLVPRSSCPDTGAVIDVMIVYTPAARVGAGGEEAITAMCQSCISSANNAYFLSGIETRLRLVYFGEVDYAEGETFNSDLAQLRILGDGVMDEVHALRDTHNADMVSLLNDNEGACGVGYLMADLSTGFAPWAFNVTDYSCAVGNLTFAHELGHNMGCHHDRDNAGDALYDFSYGHRWEGTNGTTYRSVLAYSPGARVPRFSNPDVLYSGTPTGIVPGDPAAAHNVQSINQAAWTLANFRISGEVQPPMITAPPQPASAEVGMTAMFSVSATNASTLQWSRNNIPLINSDRISGATSATLTISDVQPGDAGDYRVAVGNACATITSDPAPLSVSLPCAADYDDDDDVIVPDIFAFLTDWFAGVPAAYEFGGTAGVPAIFAFLTAWFAGCP